MHSHFSEEVTPFRSTLAAHFSDFCLNSCDFLLGILSFFREVFKYLKLLLLVERPKRVSCIFNIYIYYILLNTLNVIHCKNDKCIHLIQWFSKLCLNGDIFLDYIEPRYPAVNITKKSTPYSH